MTRRIPFDVNSNISKYLLLMVSMVGPHTLINLHKRFQEIKGITSDNIPFGGVSVLAVGDLLQLPPVGDSPVYGTPRDPLQQLNWTLWEKHFYLIELRDTQTERRSTIS